MSNVLFWQYPVITEKIFYEQNKHCSNYLGLPWATFIDKKVDLHLWKFKTPTL